MRIDFIIPKESGRLHEGEQAGHTCRLLPLSDGLNEALKEASRSPTDVLWIAHDALESPDPAAIRRYRVARPETRIVVEIPDDLAPPNAFVSAVVGMGVLDIVLHAYTLSEAIDRHPSYADVARWQGGGLSWDEEPTVKAPAQEPKDRIVEKRVPMTSRPVLIAIWGSIPGVGSSTLALHAGALLAAHSPTAVLDHEPNPSMQSNRSKSGLEVLARADRLPKNLTVMTPEFVGDTLTALTAPDWRVIYRSRKYGYIVIDAGSYVDGMAGDGGPQATLWENADLNLIVLPPAPSRYAESEFWVKLGKGVLASSAARLTVFGEFPWKFWREMGSADDTPVWPLKWPVEKGANEALRAVLAPILPDDRARGLWKWRR